MEFYENLYHDDFAGSRIGELRLFCCGKRTDAKDHSFGPAARDNYWFIYLKEGSGFYEVGKKQYPLKKGMLFTAFPNRLIHYRADPGSVWSIYWFSVGQDGMDAYLPLLRITEDHPTLTVESPSAIENTFEALFSEIPRDTLQAKLRCSGYVYQLLSLMAQPAAAAEKRDYIDEAVFYMTNNYDRPITMADTAHSVCLAPAYFSRLFRSRMGCTPSAWLTRYRLEKSLVLLRTSDLKISEIARSVGFPDALYFSRRFTEHYGCSPTCWKMRITAV